MRLAICLTVIAALAAPAYSACFQLANGYFSVSGKDGIIESMRLDPSGKGAYDRSRIISLRISDPMASAEAVVDETGHRVVLKGAKLSIPTKLEQLEANAPEQVAPGHTIGQTFVIERGFINHVEAKMPTWTTKNSAVTMTLYRMNGSKRTKAASKRLTDLKDNDFAGFDFPDQPAGKYLLELSNAKGQVGWWSAGRNVMKGEALRDGVVNPNMERSMRATGYDVCKGDYEVALDGSKLKVKFTPASGQGSPQLQTILTIPWVKSGYDTTSDKIVFDHFLTSEGLYVPVHQLKRRPHSGVSGGWVVMSGRFGSDLKFNNAPIHLAMEENSMTLNFPGAEREIELMPHSDELSEQFPSFFSSDAKIDKALNAFLLSHNFNFGVGTNPDWKDWHTLQLSWTANHQAEIQRLQFLGYKMADDGYLYCWGSDPGWPFPYKDDNKDGKNDYDTRHATTNPCFVLGAWREYCWNPDSDYLAKLMPRVRRAMEFMLKECDGDRGILINKFRGHEGRDGDIGSNYWDISPFGWKDAFTNAHYYPSIEAMAQLEEAVLRDPKVAAQLKGASPAPRDPAFYSELAGTVRKSYNDTFWLSDKGRYSGCVDKDGVTHDYGFTYVNLPAMANGLATAEQVKRVYNWMETGVTSTGKADTYSRWVFAPRACTVHIPKRDEPQTPVPSWWCLVWNGTSYEEQCQDGGAILYTSFHDILARARFLGVDNAWDRFTAILDRYAEPDHLSGGNPLYLGESTQGGPGGTAGAVGVEGEFPESGLVPVSFLYAFLGIDADIDGLKIRPNLPNALNYAGVRHLKYRGKLYDVRVTNSSVEITCTTKGHERTISRDLAPGEVFRFTE